MFHCNFNFRGIKPRKEPRNVPNSTKSGWKTELDRKGFLACPIPGCSKRFTSLTNIELHYQWCVGVCTCIFIESKLQRSAPVCNPSPPALRCLHEGCPEGESTVYTLIQCTPLLMEKADVAPDVARRFTMCKQVSVQARQPWL